mmetsp:Transcript_22863/g.20092  ORF Transcript_22863/g.20092 Transcript_22863/m.20092 type:complete len:708 (-) Transcript_22863:354-2477(-)
MGNCLQAQSLKHPTQDDIDNIGSQSTMDHRTLSMQSTSNTVSKQTLNDIDNIDIITSPSSQDPPDANPSNKSPPSSSSSNESPTVSQVSPLPHIIKKPQTQTQTHILKNINNPQSIHENLPIYTPTTTNTITATPHLSTTNSHTQSQVHFNNTIIIYDTPTQTRSNPSNQQNYLDTPNLFQLTPSNTMPSSMSHGTIPPLELTNTLTLSSKDSDRENNNKPQLQSNSHLDLYSKLNHIQPTPQHSPDPNHIDHEITSDLVMDEEEKTQISNKMAKSRKRASSHDSAGIVTLFRAKTAFSLFSLNRNKNANKTNSSQRNLPITIADNSNSIPSTSNNNSSSRKRGNTYHSKQQTRDNNDNNDNEQKNNDSNGRRRARTVTTKLSFGNRLKRSQTLHNLSSLVGFGGNKSKRSKSVHSNKHKKGKGKKKSKQSDDHIVCKPTSNKLKYVRNTPIQPLECFAMEGNIQGIISILKKYETSYPPFFMEYSNEQGHTLLMRAAFLGHFSMMKYLINRYKKYRNAIFESVEPSCGKDVASLLLDFTGDYINYESTGGKSALIFACSCKHKSRLNIVKYLLESGASVGEPKFSRHGKSPLIHAVEWKQQNLIQLLLDYGADINVQDRNNGFTPLMYAAKFNNQDLCEFLLARGADKSYKNKNNKTATELAKIDQCWASLLALDPSQIPANVLSLAATSPSKNRWGRYSLSYSYF